MRHIPLALAFLFVASCAGQQIRKDGLPVNLVQVRGDVFRSGQPLENEWGVLRELGIRHVIKLNFYDEGDELRAANSGMDVHNVAIQPSTKGIDWISAPSREAMDELFRLAEQIRDARGIYGSWLVHCQNGHDRTGLVVGLIRMVVDGWTRERAWDEMIAMGYHDALLGLNHAFREFAERAGR